MVQAEIIRRRLEALTEHLAVLERLATYSEAAFLDEPERYGAAERFLQLSLEAFLDLGNHIIADLLLQGTYYEDTRPKEANGPEDGWSGRLGSSS